MRNLSSIKALIPDYAKDVYLNLDAAVLRSEFNVIEALGIALASAFAAKSNPLVNAIKPLISKEEANAALAAASLMSINNINHFYKEVSVHHDQPTSDQQTLSHPHLNYKGVSQRSFSLFALAASIIGKCKHCTHSHYQLLKKEHVSDSQLKNVGEIAATINAVAHVIAIEQ